MAKLGANVYCYNNGFTLLSLNFVCKRSGSTDDNIRLRCVRRRAGFPDKILPGVADVVMRSDKDSKSWQWVDDRVEVAGVWSYYVQIYRIDGIGDFYEMTFTATHCKR